MRLSTGMAVFAVLAVLLSGCAGGQKMRQRGWVGGAFTEASGSMFAKDYQTEPTGAVKTLPKEVAAKQKSALVVSSIEEESSLYLAGIRAGDLIVSVNGKPATSVKAFYKNIDGMQPGSTAAVSIWRNGAVTEIPVTVGVENYRRMGYISLGFGLGGTLKLIPDPDFNIFNLVRVASSHRRNRLNSPEHRYAEAVVPAAKQTVNPGWDVWFLIFGTGKYDLVTSQSAAPAQK